MPLKLNALSPDPLEQLRFMHASLEHLSDLVVVTDAGKGREPHIVYVNQAVVNLTGYTREELIGRNPRLFQGPDTCRQAVKRIGAALNRLEPVREELLNYTCDGRAYWVDIYITPLVDSSGEVTHFVSTQTDITVRKQTEQDLMLFRHTIDQSLSSVIITDRQGRITYVNRGFEVNSGYTAEEVKGRTPGFRAWAPKSAAQKQDFWACLNSGRTWRGEFVNRHKDGRRVIKRAVVSPVRHEEGQITHFLSVEQDVTAEKEAQEQLEFLAYHDAVTALPNRRLLENHVSAALEAPDNGYHYALVLTDLDDFKRINDAHSHSFGDAVLQRVARRLEACLEGSHECAAHLGGDEFSLFLRVPFENRQALLRARIQSIQNDLVRPMRVERQMLSISACSGVAWVPEHGRDFTAAQFSADLAMHHAKQAGKGTFAFFEPRIGEVVQQRVRLEEALRNAILRDELSIAIQSQYSPSGRLSGGEVLVRWLVGPDGVPVSPGAFIPVAESSGLIKPLTLLVLDKALAVIRQMMQRGIHIPLSVNFSTDLFRDEELINGVLELLAEAGVPAELLVLEITESLFIDTHSDVLDNMGRLMEAGLKFSLDDFGTGYSNLAYLKKMHLSELKIDKSFVDNLPGDDDNRAIVRSILSIARQLKLRVVAEGVETHSQADFLAAHGCDLLQGFLLHKPEPADSWLIELENCFSEKKCHKGVDPSVGAT
ncbi:putative bifunctional diguanylate cyclase/phosphodiesterase [Marinobacterium weihaiense]|uniref:EAL domain-containing protein n=1 Tax=Marinobacterium weihaiense TaxID=2851016 RepID=A0ABS6MF51_9GAMM|nr:EAL domain-containing protein [Marinobacterium weihaiense]MBV0934923.1 EAL domain-containing protein [Marinobacterium weihaiense]